MDLWSLPMQRNFWKQQTYAPRFMPAIRLQIVARKHRPWQKYRRCLILNYARKNLLEWKCRCRLDIYTFIPMCACIIVIMTSWCFWCIICAQSSNACMKIIWSKNVNTIVSKTSLLLKLCFIVVCNLASLVKMKNKQFSKALVCVLCWCTQTQAGGVTCL
jgi:hypothetical protein